MEPVATIPRERLEHYLALTRRALETLRVVAPERSFHAHLADSFLSMAKSYFADANHNHEQGDWVLAYAQVNYAHAWVDAGARLGLWDVGGDDQLFTLYE